MKADDSISRVGVEYFLVSLDLREMAVFFLVIFDDVICFIIITLEARITV